MANRITQVREALGMDYGQFAEALGVNRSTVWRWEHPESRKTNRAPKDWPTPYIQTALRTLCANRGVPWPQFDDAPVGEDRSQQAA